MNYTIKNDYYTVTVADLGAEVVSIKTSGGVELMWQSTIEGGWARHAPLLFPICGQIKDKKYSFDGKEYAMGGHGFISKKTFTVKEQAEDRIALVCRADQDTLASYPFNFEFCAEYSLSGDTFDCRVTVKNLDTKTMPFMFGWHPAFALPTDDKIDIDDYSITFGDVEKVTWIPLQHTCFARPYGEDYLTPNGAYRLCEEQIYKNDTMIFTDTPSGVKLKANGPYELDMRWSENTPYVCIWKQPMHDAKFICIEPWTNTPGDGESAESFEEKSMHRLASGDSEIFTVSAKFTV